MTDDPLDLEAVAADDAALEGLRASTRDDAALELLRDLLLDVERDLPAPAPVGHGSTVLALVGEEGPERRLARNGAVVAALTAGLLSLGGVAAAATLAPVDSPLHGLGEAVRSAAGAVVGAVTPPEPPGRSAVALASPSATPTALPSRAAVAPRQQPTPGPTVAALARSQAAARQVDQLLVAAADLLKAGRTSAAGKRLDLAERTLTEVLPVHRGTLPKRLADLRTQASTSAPVRKAPPARPAKAPAAEPAPAADRQGSARTAPRKSQPKGGGKPAGKGAPTTQAPAVAQLSESAASVKPRA